MTRDKVASAGRFLATHVRIIAPALVALICTVAAVDALYTLTFGILGRDQGIFQYVAWALRHGARSYRDFHEINGPLPHAWHMILQSLGGEDEHVFRMLDTSFLVMVYALASLTIPEWLGERARGWERALWLLAGMGVLGIQYATYDWWHTSQREGFYSVLVYASVAAQAMGHQTRRPGRATAWFLLAGIATSLPWFGKPPCVAFSVLQLAVLVLDRATVAVSLRRAFGAAFAGALLVTGGILVFERAYGDVFEGIRLLSFVPLLHHTIWNKSLLDCYRAYNNGPRLDWAMATMAVFVATYFCAKLPRRTLLAVVLPVGGFFVFALQGKGFPYHLHMLTLGTGVVQLVLLAAFARRVENRPKQAAIFAVVVLALAIKWRDDALFSIRSKSPWRTLGATKEMRNSPEYLEQFPWGDFFAADLRKGAAFVREHTQPTDRIQTYGLDPYFLFLAQRQTGSPIIYNFEINVDAALLGGSGAKMTERDRAALIRYRDDSEMLLFTAARNSPPAAFVFFDRAPFSYPWDGEVDFQRHCPELHRWIDEHYGPASRFGTVQVRLRNDLQAASVSTARTP